MKIAFTGPSGVGKTTLCKYVEDTFGYTHLSTSAKDVLSEDHQVQLKNMGWTSKGHLDVIGLSVRNAEFAISFQDFLMEDRAKQILSNNDFVIDRSLIDVLVYRLTQASMHDNWFEYATAIKFAIKNMEELDLIIFIPCNGSIPKIEDNKSRIPNFHYQSYISSIFDMIIAKSMPSLHNKIKVLDNWDLDYRKRKVFAWINEIKHNLNLFENERI